MRIFNKHYRATKANPRSRLVTQTAQSFKRLFAKNPGKYEELYTEFFGRGGRAGKDPASHYQTLVTELALLNTVELELIKKKVDQAAAGEVDEGLTDEIRRVERRREKVERDLKKEQKRIFTPRGKMTKRGGEYRYGKEEEARLQELEAQGRKELGIHARVGTGRSSRRARLDTPVKMGIFSGIVHSPYEDDIIDLYRWELFSPAHELILSGSAKRHSSAAQALAHGHDIVDNILKGGEISRDRRRWLKGTRGGKQASDVQTHPAFDKLIKQAELGGIGGAAQAYEAPSREVARKFGRRAPSLSLGEEEEIAGKAYTVFARRDREGYWIKVHTRPDPETGKVYETGWSGPYKSLDRAYRKANLIGGQMTGAQEFLAANPARRRTLYMGARRALAKHNPPALAGLLGPTIPRSAMTGTETFADIAESIDVPPRSEDAFRVGYAWGVMNGIDTCGVQNWNKRRKLRRAYEKEILSSYAKVAGDIIERGKKGRR